LVSRATEQAARLLPGPALVALAALLVLTMGVRMISGQDAAPAQKATVRDGVFTKAQADRGKMAFTSTCAKCHSLVAGEKIGYKDEGPALAGDPFLTKWDGRTVFDLVSNIRLNMPPDGSVFLEADETADLVAYLLQVNGFPDGDHALKGDTTARDIAMAKSSR
jgi:mono/diheme cytochrome c family protein